MYLSHYKLKLKPFQMSTDPKFLWLGEKHKEALAILKYGVFENKGVLALTGDVGTGKTTLINALVEDLGKDIVVTTIYDPGLEPLEFFNVVAAALNMGETFDGKGPFLIAFKRFLQNVRQQNKKVLLIIDEAQRIGPKLLEEVRLLSNLEDEHVRLLNIFFIGQDEFVDILQTDVNRALRQRIAMSYDIKPLTLKETNAYINHRLRIAGAKSAVFTPGAVREIFAFSSGYPRLINIICDHALLSGFVKGVQTIDGDIIKECKKELHVSEWLPRQRTDSEQKDVAEERPPADRPPHDGSSDDRPERARLAPEDGPEGVRLARGLYQTAPPAKPDKIPVGLAILSVVLVLLIAGAVAHFYYHPGNKSRLIDAISFKTDTPPAPETETTSAPPAVKPSAPAAEGKYLIPFIPETKDKESAPTKTGVTSPDKPEIKAEDSSVVKSSAAEEMKKAAAETAAGHDREPEKRAAVNAPETAKQKDSGDRHQARAAAEKAPVVLASRQPAATATAKPTPGAKAEGKPKAREPVVRSEQKTPPPQADSAKATSKPAAVSNQDEAAVKPVASRKTTPESGLQQPKSVAALDRPKIVQEGAASRLKTFMAAYARAYESMNLDRLAAFFAPDAIENGRPFTQQLPKYRRNFERIAALQYDIDMNNFSPRQNTGTVSVEGKYLVKAKLAGSGDQWKQASGTISMVLEPYGDSYRIKRLSSEKRPPKTAASVSSDDLLTRLNAFLKAYSSAYENKRLDEFAGFFTADATENGKPFRSQLPKYRRDFGKIDAMDYEIDLKRYSVQEGSGLIRLEGVANVRAKLSSGNGTWRENSTGIFMELAVYGDSFKVRRLDY